LGAFGFRKNFQRITAANIKVKEFRNAFCYDAGLLAVEIINAN